MVLERAYGLAEIFVYEEKDIMDCRVIARSLEGDVAIHNGNSLMSKKLDGLAYRKNCII